MAGLAKNVLGRLARDKNLPLTELVRKAVRFGTASVTAPYYLRDCDRVGARARTPYGPPIVENRGRIDVGDDAQIISRFAPVVLAAGPRASLTIGDGVIINFGCELSAERGVTLGDRVSLGPYVRIADHDDASDAKPGAPAEVEIGDDVWLAARVRVLKGARIGRGTVVTAGSIVSGELPPGVVAGGAPARVLRRRNPADVPQRDDVAREVEAAAVDARGVLVSDFSVQELAADLARADGVGLSVSATTAPFDQVFQTLHDLRPHADGAEFAVVWTRPESIAGWARLARGERVPEADVLAEVDAFADLVLRAAESQAVRWIFVPTWTRAPYDRGRGMLDLAPGSPGHVLLRMNLRLAERFSGKSVHLLDAQRWVANAGKHAYRAKLWYMGKVGFSRSVFAEAALDIRAALRGLRGQAKKLLVLDLDDTLWGGIVGDVGWQHLRLGGHDPVGEAFVDFQRHVSDLTRRGIALAIVSKNEESVALEAIASHPEMVLRLDRVSAYRINWRDKAQNIVEIVKELNLGLQSVVFIDDNPVERARVREALPEVYVPEWPEDKLEYVPTFLGLRCFDVPRISQEDVERTRMYAEERNREGLKTAFASLDDWLLGLGIVVRFASLDASNLGRATQLLNKTNQMNIRTRRLSEAELAAWAASSGHELWTVSVADKFGDSGLTGLLGLAEAGDALEVVDYVLSCRVMGRRVEETLLWMACERARERGKSRVVAPFFPTAKNNPARSFFEGSGFAFDPKIEGFVHDARYPKPAAIRVEGDR